ncbi:Os05g0576950, partial [Oryza sativa Japonica Group]
MIFGCMVMELNSPKLNMAMPNPASERMEIDLATMIGIVSLLYRNAMSDQVRPMRLAYVLGFRISRRQTVVRMSRSITPAGAFCCPLARSAPAAPPPFVVVVTAVVCCSVLAPASSFASSSCPPTALLTSRRGNGWRVGGDKPARLPAAAEHRQAGDLRRGGSAGAPLDHVRVLEVIGGSHGRGCSGPRRRVLVEAGRPRGVLPRRRVQREEVRGAEAGRAQRAVGRLVTRDVGEGEGGAPRGGVPRRADRVDLHAGQVRRARRGGGGGGPPRHRRAAHDHAQPPVGRHLGVRLRLAALERHHVRVDVHGGDGRRGVRELRRDEHPRGAELEEEEQERVPDDGLEHDDLDHEVAGVRAVHGDEERDPHDERVGEGGDGEERDGAVERRPRRGDEARGEARPRGERGEDEHLLQGVGGDEAEVHGVGVAGGDEVEGEERDGDDGDEAVDAGALLRREDAPPPHGAVRHHHRHVQRHHRRQHHVQLVPRYH